MMKIITLKMMKTDRKYLSQFHKESTECKIAKLAAQEPFSAKEALRQPYEMHKRLNAFQK
jgi:hypothetical protein